MNPKEERLRYMHKGGEHVSADQADRLRRVVANNVDYLNGRRSEACTWLLVDEGLMEGAARLAGWSVQGPDERPACFVDGVRAVLTELGSDLVVGVEWFEAKVPGSGAKVRVWEPFLARSDLDGTNGRI